MKSKFKIGDKVVLKPNPVVFSLHWYEGFEVVPGTVYTITSVHSSAMHCGLNNGYQVIVADIELAYSEMLKKVLE